MKTRIISGAVLVVLLIPTLLLGGYFMRVVLALVSLGGIYELHKVFKLEKELLCVISFIACIFYYIVYEFKKDILIPEIIGLFLLLVFIYVIAYPKYKFKDAMVPLIAFIYAGVLVSFIFKIRSMEAGEYLVWLIFISSWICDTCAYFTGVFLGKHKAFPVLSPKKTWEGCVGGVLGGIILGIVFAIIFGSKLSFLSSPVPAVAITVMVSSVLSIVGDLAASAIKRENGIKDYSNLIPGHGGIMDRFDSVIYVAPVVYYMLRLFAEIM